MKQDYRIFVGAFLEGELANAVQAIRQQYDPVTARITPPHVTSAGTYWRSGPEPDDYAWVDPAYQDPWVDHAARNTYDYSYDGAGNWPFRITSR